MADADKQDGTFFGGKFPLCLLALLLAPLYLWCLPPGLPPYRDSGEMACAAWTLGIAHQPGYPLYIISAKLFSLIPLGNPAWRLNLFSAAAGLAGVGVFWLLAAEAFSGTAAFFAALLLGLNFTLRTVSGVPEMYALNFLFACLLLKLAQGRAGAPSAAAVFSAAFLLGLGMANRMDLLLAAPALLVLAWPRLRAGGLRDILKAAGFFLLGFSLYLYLPVRSAGNPLFDWSHPADLGTFFAVITRKSYGSTLDLISANYAPGELFLPNLKYYALHLWHSFGAALILCAAGLWAEWRSAPRRLLAFGALFLCAGPVFLYMANMPPNPHALAIVEPYYLLPDLALAFWAAAGFSLLAPLHRLAAPALALFCAVSALFPLCRDWYAADRRSVFAAGDYAGDVLASAPPASTIVAKKDVQLFSLWYLQAVEGLRPDVNIVAQGLSGSPWYQRSAALYRPGLKLYNLNNGGEADWKAFAAANGGRVYATLDAEVPRSAGARPAGLLNELYPAGPAAAAPWDLYAWGRLEKRYHDFFDKDLGSAYAQALLAGASLPAAPRPGLLAAARLFDPDIPDIPLYEGIYYSGRGEWPRAGAAFLESALIYERLAGLAEEYHSLPALRSGIASAGAYAWLNYGVTLEKTGDKAGAERAYAFALAKDPALAEAHFNLAILYWNRDWARVRSELQETLRLNPGHPSAGRYLEQVRNR